MNKEEIEEAVSGTGLAELSIGYSVIALLKYKGISIEEFHSYWEHVMEEQKDAVIQAERNRKEAVPLRFTCEKCGERAILAPVTISLGKENVYGWKSVIRCFDCGHEKFSTRSVNKILRRMTKNTGRVKRRKCHGNSI